MARFLFCLLLAGGAGFALSPDDLSLLRDAGGWEYQTVTDAGNGFTTQAVCFGPSSTGQCKGSLLFRQDGTFEQTITAHGSSVHRGGKYQVDGDSVTFFDEFNNQDGPYTVHLNTDQKTLHMEAVRAGANAKMDLLLEREFHKRMQGRKK